MVFIEWDPLEHPRYPDNGEFAPQGEGEVIIGRTEHPRISKRALRTQAFAKLGVNGPVSLQDVLNNPKFALLTPDEKFAALGSRSEEVARSIAESGMVRSAGLRAEQTPANGPPQEDTSKAIAESKQRWDLDYTKMTEKEIMKLRSPQLTPEQFDQLVDKPFQVWTTEFAGGKEEGNTESAYSPKHQVDPKQFLSALPAYIAPKDQRWIRVTNPNNGRTIDVQIDDNGPYNIADAYWQHADGTPNSSGRPMTEWQYSEKKIPQNGHIGAVDPQPPSSKAGLDVTPAVFDALGVEKPQGKENSRAMNLIWQFIHPPTGRK